MIFLNVIATDHCPSQPWAKKDAGINNFHKNPNGGNGVEEAA